MEKIQGLENIDKVDEFIKLTEQALKDEEKYKIWNAGKSMYGIYGEKDKGTYMVRPRFIESKITLDNLTFFLNLVEKYGDKRLHLTTRQDIQLHGNKKEDLAKILKELKANGFVTKATGGDAARAVITPPTTGFEEEVINVAPYSKIVTEHILETGDFMFLPRKFKVAFSNKEENSLYVKIADVGFEAVEKDGIKGFRVFGGGSLGNSPKEAIMLKDFVEHHDILYYVIAMRNLFNEHGDRKIRGKARLRFILIRLGDKEFLKLFNAYLDEIYKKEGDKYKNIVLEKSKKYKNPYEVKAIKEDKKEILIKSPNVIKGKIEGRYGYFIRLPKGDINIKEGNKLVEFLKSLDYKIEMRLTSHQELFVANLKKEDIYILDKLSNKYSKKRFFSSISCIGSTICNPGILDTPPILEMILKYFKNKQRLASYLPKIQLSGCPNSCAAHQIAELGFQGKRKKDGAYFNVFVGGEFKTKDVVTLNKSVGELKAETIPLFLEEMAKILKERKITYEIYSKQEDFIDLVKKFEGVI